MIINYELGEPSYEKWIRSRFWTESQTKCILLRLPVLEEMFLNIFINSNSLSDYINYLAYYPINKKQLQNLKRLNYLMLEAIRLGELTITQQQEKVLISPNDAINWVETNKEFPLPSELLKMKNQVSPHSTFQADDLLEEDILISRKFTTERLMREQSDAFFYSIAMGGVLEENIDDGFIHDKLHTISGQLKAVQEEDRLYTEKAHHALKKAIEARDRVIVLAKGALSKAGIGMSGARPTPEYMKVCDEEFEKYHKRVPPLLFKEHECRALGLLLRDINPKIKIREIENHEFVREFVWFQKNASITSDSFRKWIHREGIYDQEKKRNC